MSSMASIAMASIEIDFGFRLIMSLAHSAEKSFVFEDTVELVEQFRVIVEIGHARLQSRAAQNGIDNGTLGRERGTVVIDSAECFVQCIAVLKMAQAGKKMRSVSRMTATCDCRVYKVRRMALNTSTSGMLSPCARA